MTGTVLVRPSAVWIRCQDVFKSAPTHRMVIILFAYSSSFCGSRECIRNDKMVEGVVLVMATALEDAAVK